MPSGAIPRRSRCASCCSEWPTTSSCARSCSPWATACWPLSSWSSRLRHDRIGTTVGCSDGLEGLAEGRGLLVVQLDHEAASALERDAHDDAPSFFGDLHRSVAGPWLHGRHGFPSRSRRPTEAAGRARTIIAHGRNGGEAGSGELPLLGLPRHELGAGPLLGRLAGGEGVAEVGEIRLDPLEGALELAGAL